jgi:hypothetical protein
MGDPNLPPDEDYGDCPDCLDTLPETIHVHGSHYISGPFWGDAYKGFPGMYQGNFPGAGGETISVMLWFCFGTDELFCSVYSTDPESFPEDALIPGVNGKLPVSHTFDLGSSLRAGSPDYSYWNYAGGLYPDSTALLEKLYEDDDVLSIRTVNKLDGTNFAIKLDKKQIP